MAQETQVEAAKASLKERMEQQKSNFQTVVEAYTGMIGVWLTMTAPTVSQAVSAFTIGFALFEGLQTYLHTPWYVALIIGGVSAWAVESIGFTAVEERDQSQAHNQRTKDPARHLSVDKAEEHVSTTFWVTMAIVFVCEVVPSGWGLFNGTTGVPDFLFRCSLLLWPKMSRLGAQLYAFRAVRLAADTSADDQELQALRLELTKREMVAESELRVKSQRKMVAKNTLPDSVKTGDFQGKMDDFTLNSGYNGQGKIAVANDGKQRKITERHDAIVSLCTMYGAMSAPDLSAKLMADRGVKASAQTVGDDCRQLVADGRLVTVGKKWDIDRPRTTELPALAEVYTNGVNHH